MERNVKNKSQISKDAADHIVPAWRLAAGDHDTDLERTHRGGLSRRHQSHRRLPEQVGE